MLMEMRWGNSMPKSWWSLQEAGAYCGDINNGFEFAK